MSNPNHVGTGGTGTGSPANYYDFTNSSGAGAGGTATNPVQWVVPASGAYVNAFSVQDWNTYMSKMDKEMRYALITGTGTNAGAIMILGYSVLTS